MRATEVAAPGAVVRLGKGVSAHCVKARRQRPKHLARTPSTYSLLNIVHGLARRQERLTVAKEGLGRRDHLGEVDHRIGVLAELGQIDEDELEVRNELRLIV